MFADYDRESTLVKYLDIYLSFDERNKHTGEEYFLLDGILPIRMKDISMYLW
jgi:hypothetical protein